MQVARQWQRRRLLIEPRQPQCRRIEIIDLVAQIRCAILVHLVVV